MASATSDRTSERRKQVMLGDLPQDFLRLNPTDQQQQISADEQAALALQQQLSGGVTFRSSNAVGRLTISVIEAKLVKNYGVTRMDPYVRIRIGHNVYETHTDYNGAKNPKWNKVFHCFLTTGVTAFLVEIYDECAFTVNEKIAWAHITIPEQVFTGETCDIWHPLSGRQGEGREGAINVVMSYTKHITNGTGQPFPVAPGALTGTQVVLVNTPYLGMMPTVPGVVHYPSPAYVYPYTNQVQPGSLSVQQTPLPTGQPNQMETPGPQFQISDADVKQILEMFPNMEVEVIKGVLETHGGNKDAAINALLTMNS